MQLRSGDIVFLRGRSLWSRLIRLRSESVFSHCGLVADIKVKTPNGEPIGTVQCVIESLEPHGVRIVPFRVWESWGCEIDVYAPTHNLDKAEMLREAIKHVGKRYATPWQFLRSWGLLTRRIARRLRLKPDTNTERFFCSEFVAVCLRAGGAKLHAAPAAMTPGDVSLLSCLKHVGRLFPN